jgi:hypothetical protein
MIPRKRVGCFFMIKILCCIKKVGERSLKYADRFRIITGGPYTDPNTNTLNTIDIVKKIDFDKFLLFLKKTEFCKMIEWQKLED